MSERLTKSLWPNPDNPRRDIENDPDFPGLVASIRSQGIIQPLLIRDDGMIWAGHRRHAAALLIGLERVPIIVLGDQGNRILVPLIENLQRSDLTVLEVAEYLNQCSRVHGMKPTEISEVTGISAATIYKYIKLANAPLELRERIDRDEIPLTAAFELLRHDEEFIKEVVATPKLTKAIVRERAARPRSRVRRGSIIAQPVVAQPVVQPSSNNQTGVMPTTAPGRKNDGDFALEHLNIVKMRMTQRRAFAIVTEIECLEKMIEEWKAKELERREAATPGLSSVVGIVMRPPLPNRKS